MSPEASTPAARAGSSVRTPAEQVVRDIRRATRKHHSVEDEIRIVLEGLRGEESIAALCRSEGTAESRYSTWPKDFLGSAHELKTQVAAFVEHYNHQRCHEGLGNLTPADVCCGRGQTILPERERSKRRAIQQRRLLHRSRAA
jgi:hypothetical protein